MPERSGTVSGLVFPIRFVFSKNYSSLGSIFYLIRNPKYPHILSKIDKNLSRKPLFSLPAFFFVFNILSDILTSCPMRNNAEICRSLDRFQNQLTSWESLFWTNNILFLLDFQGSMFFHISGKVTKILPGNMW